MNKIALTLAVLAGLSSAAFASQRNQDPAFVINGNGGSAGFEATDGINSTQGAAVYTGDTGNSAIDAQRRNMEIQSQSNRK